MLLKAIHYKDRTSLSLIVINRQLLMDIFAFNA